jgi:ferrochelatase
VWAAASNQGVHYNNLGSGSQRAMARATPGQDLALAPPPDLATKHSKPLDVDWAPPESGGALTGPPKIKRGVLLINVGTPDEPTVPSVERYLDEFLMDPDVIDIPAPLRYLLVQGVVLKTRPPKIAPRYASIWMPEGAPLRVYTKRMADALSNHLNGTACEVGMRYGNPSIRAALDRLREQGVTDLLVAPLFPHFAQATTGTSTTHTRKQLKDMGWFPRIRELGDFPHASEFIDPLVASIRPRLGPGDHLLFSYHGLPTSQIRRQDKSGEHCLEMPNCCSTPCEANKKCYAHQCTLTTLNVVGLLGLTSDRWSMSFQSRLGPAEWLSPSTTDKVQELAARGIERLVIVSPAFLADGLETLEELEQEVREEFIEAGGKDVVVVPCLNDNADWIEGLGGLVTKAFEKKPVAALSASGPLSFIDQVDSMLRGGRQ